MLQDYTRPLILVHTTPPSNYITSVYRTQMMYLCTFLCFLNWFRILLNNTHICVLTQAITAKTFLTVVSFSLHLLQE